MLVVEKTALSEEILRLVEQYGGGRETLLQILQEIQDREGYISDFAQQEIARALNIHPVEVYGVVTFYSFLHTKPEGRHIVRLCRTISCDLQNKDAIAKALERELGVKFDETTRDKKFSLEYTNCIGMCDSGPAMMINEQVFTKVTPHSVVDILKKFK